MDGTADTKVRGYSPTELAFLISTFRQTHGWSQETVAELANLNPRTVQRVEAGKLSSLDTRRALARAFDIDDVDAFNRTHEFTTVEGAEKAKADFDRRYLVLEVEPSDGRSILRALQASGPYRAIHPGMVGQPPREAEDLYAACMDYVGDLLDVHDIGSNVELLTYADELEGTITDLRAHGWELAHCSRRVLVTKARIPTDVSYLILVPTDGGKRHVAVLRGSTCLR